MQGSILHQRTIPLFNHVQLEGFDRHYPRCPLTDGRLEQALGYQLRLLDAVSTHLVAVLLKLRHGLTILYTLDSRLHPACRSACLDHTPISLRSNMAFRLAFRFSSIQASLFLSSKAAFQHLSIVLWVKYECAL